MALARAHQPRHNTRQAQIYRVAAQIFLEKGFDATSVNDIAAALGMTKAGLYHYISSKESLLLDIMAFGLDRLDAEVIAPTRAIADPVERLQQIMLRHSRIAIRGQGSVTQLSEEVRALPLPGRKRITKRMRAYVDYLRDTIGQIKSSRRLRDVDVTVAAFSVLAMILWLPRWFRPGGRLSADEAAAGIVDVAMNGILQAPHSRGRARTLRLVKKRR